MSPTAYSIVSHDPTVEIVGGAELQQVIIARELVRRGYAVSMICSDHGQADALKFDDIIVYKCFRLEAGIPVIRAITPRMTGMWSALQRANADIYFQRTAVRNTGIVAAFAKKYGKHSVHSAANDPDFAPGLPKIRFFVDKWIFSFGVRNVDKIVVQNEYQQALCLKQFGRESTIISNCLPSPRQRHADTDGYVLWVATFKREKRPELLLQLAQHNPSIRFRMIGGPVLYGKPFYDEIERKAVKINNVDFVGFVPYAEVDRHFDGARLFVNTSDYEGFPNTFLQAWSRQVPTVSFINLNATHQDKPVGRSVANLTEMSEIVCKLMRDDELWLDEGARCQAYFDRHHAVGPVVDQYELLFRSLLSGH